ncbi:hypothetical protein ALT1644_10159 [Alteromonas macleodii]
MARLANLLSQLTLLTLFSQNYYEVSHNFVEIEKCNLLKSTIRLEKPFTIL